MKLFHIKQHSVNRQDYFISFVKIDVGDEYLNINSKAFSQQLINNNNIQFWDITYIIVLCVHPKQIKKTIAKNLSLYVMLLCTNCEYFQRRCKTKKKIMIKVIYIKDDFRIGMGHVLSDIIARMSENIIKPLLAAH